VEYRGSDCDGHVQWCALELRIGRICHGEPVCDLSLTFVSYIPTDAFIFVPSSCHLGNVIEYDTVTNLSWSVDVRTHAIAQLVDKVLSEPWAAAEELGREVPPMKRQDDCVVSFVVPRHNSLIRAVVGLLQMGLWKLQLIIGTFPSTCPCIRFPKVSPNRLQSETIIIIKRMFVTDKR
jgi:hypothetical protein